MNAANDVARTLVARAILARAEGDGVEARRLVEQALLAFAALGTLDEPSRARAVAQGLTT